MEYSSPRVAPHPHVNGYTALLQEKKVRKAISLWQEKPYLLELQVWKKRCNSSQSDNEARTFYRSSLGWLLLHKMEALQFQGDVLVRINEVARYSVQHLLLLYDANLIIENNIISIWGLWHDAFAKDPTSHDNILQTCVWLTWGLYHQTCIQMSINSLCIGHAYYATEVWICHEDRLTETYQDRRMVWV